MRSIPPVFRNKRDLKLWKQIFTRTGSTQRAIDEILSSEEPVHSAVLVGAIEYLDRNWERSDARSAKKASKAGIDTYRTQKDIIKDVVHRSRITDCMAAVTAARVMLSRSDIEGAYEMLEIAKRADETQHTSLVLADICMAEGDMIGARDAAVKTYRCDPSIERSYEILNETDPEGEWLTRQAIHDVHCGRIPMFVPMDGNLQNLYTIYDLWYKRDHVRSSELLAESEGYLNGDTDHILVAARMSADEHDWASAIKLYLSILDEYTPTYLRCEMAEVMLSGGDIARAKEILDASDPKSIRVLEDRVKACASDGEGLDEAIATLLDCEFAYWTDVQPVVRMFMLHNRIDEADMVLELFTGELPDNSQALAMLSQVRMLQGKSKNAMMLAKRAARDHKSIPAKVQMARMMFVNGDIKGADRKCSKVLETNPSDLDALALRRDILIEGQVNKDALDVCRSILASEPNNTENLIAMSKVLSALGETEGSTGVFRRALRADLNWGNSRKVIESLIHHGMNIEAVDVCTDLEDAFPDKPMLFRLKGNSQYSQGMYADAVESYTRALDLDMNDAVVWHSKGMAEEMMGDYADAEDSYNRAAILNLSEPTYWISKASIQEINGDLYGAVESLNRAIELDPRSVYALVRKASLFSASGRVKEATYYMEMALITAPDDRDLLAETIRMHIKSDMAVKALPLAKHLYELSHSVEAADLYARCLMIDGDADTAMDVISRTLSDNPDDISLLRCKFECLLYTRDVTFARDTMRRIATIVPDYPDLDSMSERLDAAGESSVAGLKMDEGLDTAPAEEPTGDVDETPAKAAPEVGEDAPDEETPVTVTEPIGDGDGEEVDLEAPASGADDGPTVSEPTIVEEVPAGDDDGMKIEVTDEKPIILGEDTPEEEPMFTVGPISEDATDAADTVHIEVTDEEPIILEEEHKDTSLAVRDSVAFIESGDVDSAIPILEMVVDTEPHNTEAHSLLGYAYHKVGNIGGCVSELDTAIFQNTEDPMSYYLRGSIHQSEEEVDDAIVCYKKAVSRGCEDPVVMRALAHLYCMKEDYGSALRTMSNVMDNGPDNASDVIHYADLARFCGDDAAVTRSVNLFRLLDADIEETVIFARVLEDAGHADDAARLMRSDDEPVEVSPSLKKSAEKVMRYACSTGMSPYDSDVYDNCNMDLDEAKIIIDYISNIPDYGKVGETMPDYEEMELRSMDIILKCKLTDLESGIVPIDLVFTKGGCKSLDDAIKMCSYIQTLLRSEADSDDPGLIEIAMQVPGDATLFNIVEQACVGIYGAKAIKAMASR